MPAPAAASSQTSSPVYGSSGAGSRAASGPVEAELAVVAVAGPDGVPVVEVEVGAGWLVA